MSRCHLLCEIGHRDVCSAGDSIVFSKEGALQEAIIMITAIDIQMAYSNIREKFRELLERLIVDMRFRFHKDKQ